MKKNNNNNYHQLFTHVGVGVILAHSPIMKLQVKSQTTPIVNREATEMTLVLGRMIPMMDDVPFPSHFVAGIVRTVSAVERVLNRF